MTAVRRASAFRVATGVAIVMGSAACLGAMIVRGPLGLAGTPSFGPPSVVGMAGLVVLAAGLVGLAADTPLSLQARGIAGSALTVTLGILDVAATTMAEGLGIDTLLLTLGFVAGGIGAVGLGLGLRSATPPSPTLAGLLIVGGIGLVLPYLAWIGAAFLLVGLAGLGARVIAVR